MKKNNHSSEVLDQIYSLIYTNNMDKKNKSI